MKLSKDQVLHFFTNKRSLASFGILSCFMVVGLSQMPTNIHQEVKGSRGIASIGPSGEFHKPEVIHGIHRVPRNAVWEHALARQLGQKRKRDLASVGKRPTQMDRLLFGLLEGKYAVRREKGKIVEIEFSDTQRSGDLPKFINDRIGFIQENKALFPVDFKMIQKTETRKPGSQTPARESYKLMDKVGQQTGQVHFHLDKYGRFLSMQVVSRSVSSSENDAANKPSEFTGASQGVLKN